MYCSSCGANLAGNPAFCNLCGAATGLPATPVAQNTNSTPGLVGFSPKISDPSFEVYSKKSNRYALFFAIGLAVIAMIAFPIYGNKSGEMDFPKSLFYGMGIGGMFVAIALIQTIRKNTDKTWDGHVIDKGTYIETSYHNDSRHSTRTTVYVVKVKSDEGKTKKHKWRNLPGLYHYYQIGDKVRHHKGFSYYEKYDKSGDSTILCIACSTMNDIHMDACKRCKCPLLKPVTY